MSGTDDFNTFTGGLSGPATRAFAVTTHNTNELAHYTRGISFAADGDIAVVTVGGDTVTATLVGGVIHPIRAKIIKTTGTTVSNIIGWY